MWVVGLSCYNGITIQKAIHLRSCPCRVGDIIFRKHITSSLCDSLCIVVVASICCMHSFAKICSLTDWSIADILGSLWLAPGYQIADCAALFRSCVFMLDWDTLVFVEIDLDSRSIAFGVSPLKYHLPPLPRNVESFRCWWPGCWNQPATISYSGVWLVPECGFYP